MMEKEQRKQLVIQMLTAGIITFCLLWLLFYIKKYVPFGVHSLASKDADFQYLDFLAYLKDVFDGKNNIDYSFSKSIGGACIGVFSYYLSSPFNLLLLLFACTEWLTVAGLLCFPYQLHWQFCSTGIWAESTVYLPVSGFCLNLHI